MAVTLQAKKQMKDQPSAQYKIMAGDHHHLLRPPTPEMVNRSSFSSIRENDSDLTQTFTSSRVSSLLATHEHAIEDDEPRNTMVEAQFRPPVTHPDSRLLGYWSPADTFKGWKQINVRGKLASKSFGDLQLLNLAWHHPRSPLFTPRGACLPGEAAFEKLPIELLGEYSAFVLYMDYIGGRLTSIYRLYHPPAGA
jgi:hypothetical protein